MLASVVNPEMIKQTPYFSMEEDGDVHAFDPLTNERLQRGVIPESLLADDELRAGYQFLAAHGKDIQFGLILAPHGERSDLADAGVDLRAEATEVAKAGGILFLERSLSEEEQRKFEAGLNQMAGVDKEMAAEIRHRLASPEYAKTYDAGLMSGIAGTGARIVLPDYAKDSPRPADRVLATWHAQMEEIAHQEGDRFEGIKAMDEWQAMNLGFTIYRDWYLVGKMGYKLARLADAGELGEPGQPIVAKLSAGANHANIGTHMERLGAQVSYVGEHEEAVDKQSTTVRAAGRAALTLNERIDLTAGYLRQLHELESVRD